MARATRIYVLYGVGYVVLACFTVKHEALSFAKKLVEKYPEDYFWISSGPDNGDFDGKKVWSSYDGEIK